MIDPTQWKPIGVKKMEAAALRAVRSSTAVSVVAGPGAGKTELLAQRVCYLLQTGLCTTPQRILAISFKRDAAANLQKRVKERAGSLASRFDSFTFDAFSKSIVDRFLPAIPDHLRPVPDYEIVSPTKKDVEKFLQSLKPPSNLGTSYEIGSLDPDEFVRDWVVGFRLPIVPQKPKSLQEWAAQELWKAALSGTTSRLSFPMIGRLAEQLLRVLPNLLTALRQTYAYVLLDEFQDTTHVQYEFLATAFLQSPVVVTAVGDHRQRIMGWAMALKNAFERFDKDFKAKREELVMNFRSSPELVAIQEFLIRALDQNCALPQSAGEPSGLKDHCQILNFPDHEVEAKYIAARVARTLKNDKVSPRDICILVKQKPDIYAARIFAALAEKGIRARNESELQDLLTEPLVQLLIALIRLSLMKAPSEWSLATNVLAAVRRVDSEGPGMNAVEAEVVSLCANLGKELARASDQPATEMALRNTIASIGDGSLKGLYHQYKRGSFFVSVISQLSAALWRCFESRKSWADAVDDLIGTDVIPIMTIHKSKGLEYHTVIFVGLEDSAFWNFKKQSEEDTCAFFVAFSRAKARVLFTFSKQRTTRPHVPNEAQTRNSILPLYALLSAAGVRSYSVDQWPPVATSA